MGRSTDLTDYKHLWKDIGYSTYQIDEDGRIEATLKNGDIVASIPPHYAALHYNGVYILLSVNGNNTIVSSFELKTMPNTVTYEAYTIDSHCRDRMSQRQITTGIIREFLKEYIVFDRVSQNKFKLCSRIEEDEYYMLVDTQEQVIETVWRN